MEDVVADSVANSRSVTTVLSLFSAAALALAALGLHGVLSFFVAQRVHEIGIRAALGASRASVLRLVVSRGMLLVGIGVAIGTIGAVGAARLIEGLLFEISGRRRRILLRGRPCGLHVPRLAGPEGGSDGSVED
jgi:ABC-type antimicrobial peptide transport system permease subunit